MNDTKDINELKAHTLGLEETITELWVNWCNASPLEKDYYTILLLKNELYRLEHNQIKPLVAYIFGSYSDSLTDEQWKDVLEEIYKLEENRKNTNSPKDYSEQLRVVFELTDGKEILSTLATAFATDKEIDLVANLNKNNTKMKRVLKQINLYRQKLLEELEVVENESESSIKKYNWLDKISNFDFTKYTAFQILKLEVAFYQVYKKIDSTK